MADAEIRTAAEAPVSHGRWRERTALAALVFVAAVGALIVLRPLLPVDETRYLTVAWEMWTGGSRFVPHLNGELYAHKPPLLFWLINLVWSVTGPSELAARLVAPAFGAAAVVLTAMFARRLWPTDPRRAGNAAMILATTGVFLAYGSATMFDTMLTVATLVSLMSVWSMARSVARHSAIGLAAGLALGVLAKGPVILVHVLPVALLMPVWAASPARTPLRTYYAGIGWAILGALAIVLVWLGPALVLGGAEYRAEVLWKQSAGRVVASFAHDRPVWLFLALLPLFLWPWGWSVGWLAALAPARLRADSAGRFVVVWVLSALALFSAISGKQIHYLLPEMPALALLLSAGAAGRPLWSRLAAAVPAVLLLVVAAAAWLGVIASINAVPIRPLNLVLAAAVVALLVWLALRPASSRLPVALVAPLTLIALEILAMPALWRTYDPNVIASRLAPYEPAGIATTDLDYAGQFTFSARLTQPIATLAGGSALADWVAAHPGGLVFSKSDDALAGLDPVARDVFHGNTYRFFRVPARPE